MAKPVGLDLTAHSSSNNTEKQDHILYSWYGSDDASTGSAGSDTDLSFVSPAQNEATARNLALNEFLTSKRGDLRGRLLDQPASRADSVKTDDVPSVTLVDNAPAVAARADVQAKTIAPTNLEITYNKPEVLNRPLTVSYSPEQLVDMGFAQLRQLEGPNSMSSRWMAQNRPDLAAQFASDSSSLQIGSHPDGTVHKILTSPEGNRWSMTAKGSTSVEIITDRNGLELFKHAGRASSTKDVLSA